MASYVGSGITIQSSASLSSYTTGTNGGSNYTVGSGSNRAIFIIVHGYLDSSANAAGCASVTHNGQSAVTIGALPKVVRTWLEIWHIENPTAGAGGTTVATNALQRALQVTVVEANDVDQTNPVHATFASYTAAGGLTKQFALTTHAANALLIAGVAIQAGAGAFSASDGGTLAQSGQTGSLGTNDVSGGVAYEAIATAQAETLSITWTNGDNNVGVMIEVQNAASGNVGAAAGTGAASAVGQTTVEASGATSGAGAAAAIGQTTIVAVGSASGAGAANAVSGSGSAGAASGSGQAAAVGQAVISSDASATGSGTASAFSAGGSVGAASGSGLATATGQKTIQATANSSGVGAASAVAQSGSIGSAAGSGQASAMGRASVIVIGSASGVASVLGISPTTLNSRFAYPGSAANGGALSSSLNILTG